MTIVYYWTILCIQIGRTLIVFILFRRSKIFHCANPIINLEKILAKNLLNLDLFMQNVFY